MITREFETQYNMHPNNNSMMRTVSNTPRHLSPIRNRNANLDDFTSGDKGGINRRRAATQMKLKEKPMKQVVADEVIDYISNNQ